MGKKNDYFESYCKFKRDVVLVINNILEGRTVDVENKDFEVLVSSNISGETFNCYVAEVSEYDFTTTNGATYDWFEMDVASLCLIADYLLESRQ